MVRDRLDTIDIHAGGEDLIFPITKMKLPNPKL